MMGVLLAEGPPVEHATFPLPYCGTAWFCTVSGDSLASSAIALVLTVVLVMAVAYRVSHGVPGRLQLALETVYGYIRRGTVFHDNAADYLGRESG